jgi:hypothetical protein
MKGQFGVGKSKETKERERAVCNVADGHYKSLLNYV